MKRTGLIVTITVLTSLMFVGLRFLPDARATTLYVGGGGPGNYTTIQAAIDDALPGDTVFVYSGVYQGEIIIGKTLSLVGEDRNTTIISGFGATALINVEADWVNLTGFTVTDLGPSPLNRGAKLYLARNCDISTNQFTNNYIGIDSLDSANTTIADNIFMDNLMGVSLSNSSNGRIAGNVASGNSIGISIYSSANVIVTDNNFHSNGGEGLFLDWTTDDVVTANTFTSDGIYIRGRSIPEFNTHIISMDNEVNGKPIYYYKDLEGLSIDGTQLGQLIIANCTDVNVSNLHINDTDVGIEFGFVDRASVAHNSLMDTYRGIDLWYSERTNISKNDIWDGGGITTWNSNDIVVADNTLEEGCTIHPVRSTNVTIADNTLTNCGHAIFPQSSENLYISNNELLQSGEGVRGQAISNVTINGNTFSESVTGVRTFSSTNITIVDNQFLDNYYHGVRLQGSSNITITSNNIVSSGTGVGLEYTSPVLVHHNNFINNTRQANDERANLWDDDYPSGGNYWSDYAGVDNCSGPNQDVCPDPDGIGDTPYVIDSDSADRYPLMSPPVVVPPRPPTVLRADLSGKDFENVTFQWSLSPDDGSGMNTVWMYGIWRGSFYDPEGAGYGFLNHVPNGTDSFVDSFKGEGDPNNYFYYVCAVDLGNQSSCSAGQVGKFTRPLAQGPNLVSIPLIQSSESIEIVLQTVKYDKAWYYNSSSREWKWHMKSKDYRRGLWNMNHTTGIWLNITSDCNLTVAGVVPAQTTIHLYQGWNLVSFPSFNSSYTTYDLKMDTGAVRVEGYDPTPPYYLRVLGDADVLQPGEAYWVSVEADVDWIVEVS